MRLKIIVPLFLILLMQRPLSADMLILKGGEPIKGKIVEETDDYVKVDYEGAVTIFFRDQIVNIGRDSRPFLNRDNRRGPKIDKPDSPGPFEPGASGIDASDLSGNDQAGAATSAPVSIKARQQRQPGSPLRSTSRQSSLTGDDLLIEEVLELSGEKSLVGHIPKYFIFFLQEEPFVSSGEYRQKLSQIIREDLSADSAYEIFFRYIKEHYHRGNFLEISNWLATPLSKKISGLKDDLKLISAGSEPQRLYAGLESNYGGRRRLNFFKEQDDIFGRADIDVKTQISVVKALGEILNSALPAPQRIKQRKINQHCDEINFQSKELVKKNIAENAYAYRSLTNQELKEYIDFFASDTGQEFIALTHLAYFNTIRELTLILKRKMLERRRLDEAPA